MSGCPGVALGREARGVIDTTAACVPIAPPAREERGRLKESWVRRLNLLGQLFFLFFIYLFFFAKEV